MQAEAAGYQSTLAATEANCDTQSVSQPQASHESGVAVRNSVEQDQANTQQGNALNLSDSTHSRDDLDESIVQVIVDPCLFK